MMHARLDVRELPVNLCDCKVKRGDELGGILSPDIGSANLEEQRFAQLRGFERGDGGASLRCELPPLGV